MRCDRQYSDELGTGTEVTKCEAKLLRVNSDDSSAHQRGLMESFFYLNGFLLSRVRGLSS
jgi:hypothetical protein